MSGFIKKMKDMIIDDEEEETFNDEEETASDYEEPVNKDVKSVPSKVIIVEPKSFEEAETVAKHLLNKKAVVVNIHRLQDTYAQRMLDYLSGVIYAIKGDGKRVDKNVYLFAPNELPVDGSINSEN